MRKYNGAISLFMVVILLTSFIFGGVFIDASRVKVAQNKVRNAMNTSLRSAMSYYDKALVGDYGMYAFDKSEAEKNFKKYFELNMITKDENLKMFDYKITFAGISGDTPIVDDDEFRRQLVEYSKYRAPVTTTMLLVEKVASVFTNMKKSSDKINDSADAVDEFKKKYKENANQMSKALSSAKTRASNKIKEVMDNNIAKVKDDAKYVGEIKKGVKDNFDDIFKSINDSYNTMDKMDQDTKNYKKKAEQDIEEISGGKAGISDGKSDSNDDGIGDNYPRGDKEKDVAEQAEDQTGQSGTLRNAVGEMKEKITGIKNDVDALVAQLERVSGYLAVAKTQLEACKKDEKNKKEAYNEKKNLVKNTYEQLKSYEDAQNNYNYNKQKASEFEQYINNDLLSYSDNTEYFDALNIYKNPDWSPEFDSKNQETSRNDIRNRLRKQYTDLKEKFDTIDTYEKYVSNMNAAQKAMNNSGSVKQAYESAVSEKNTAENAYNNAKQMREQKQKAVDDYSDQIDDINRSIKDKLKELKNVFTPEAQDLKIGDILKDKIKEALEKNNIVASLEELFTQLTAQMDSYKSGARGSGEEDVDSMLEGGIIKKVKAVCRFASEFFNTFTNIENLRDNTYTVDYIMDKCTYLTSQTPRNHHFLKGEVEYIIFGKKNQVANIVSCILTITAMRFAINFIDYFITGPGDLIAKAIYALGRGAAKTALDMQNMLLTQPDTRCPDNIKDGVGLCPSFKSLKLTYSDHLRLLLFFKFSQAREGLKDTIYTNMMKTLSGKNINELYTRMKANVEVEVNLIILPVFVGEFTGSHFHNGNYVIKDEATLGY